VLEDILINIPDGDIWFFFNWRRDNKKKDNPGKLTTYGIEDKDKQTKNTAPYELDINIHKQTHNVNKIWALLQTTGGKDEQNIVWYSLTFI
jgi:hypothetical protein